MKMNISEDEIEVAIRNLYPDKIVVMEDYDFGDYNNNIIRYMACDTLEDVHDYINESCAVPCKVNESTVEDNIIKVSGSDYNDSYWTILYDPDRPGDEDKSIAIATKLMERFMNS